MFRSHATRSRLRARHIPMSLAGHRCLLRGGRAAHSICVARARPFAQKNTKQYDSGVTKPRKKRQRRPKISPRRPRKSPPTITEALASRLEQVEWILRETVATAREVFGAGHPYHSRAVDHLAEYLRRAGREGEADALSRLPGMGGSVAGGVGGRAPLPPAFLPRSQPVLLDIRAAARYLAISRETLYKLVRLGEVPHVRIGKSIRFRTLEIDQYLEERATRDWSRVDGRGRPRGRR